MNYFEFYEIPMSFQPDLANLKRRYYALSRKYHPDFFTMESEEVQEEALEKSTINNQAYKVLGNKDACMKYVLELLGQLGEEGQHSLSQDFLMEMMEVNEALMELEFDYDANKYEAVKKDLTTLETGLYNEVAPLLTSFEPASPSEADLQRIKDYYHKKRYLLRIRENLNKFAGT